MICTKCKTRFDEDEYAYWDEASSGSVKYTQCPGCNKVTILKYIYDYDFRKCSFEYDLCLDKYKKLYEKIKISEKE